MAVGRETLYAIRLEHILARFYPGGNGRGASHCRFDVGWTADARALRWKTTGVRKPPPRWCRSKRGRLVGFALVNGRLPCPDTNTPPDGRENCPSGAPNDLPYADLGVSATDAWGNAWIYAVTNAFTTPFTLATVGDIDVGTIDNGCANALLADNVPALVWSEANTDNGGGLEQENSDGDPCFIDAGYSQVVNGFDDLLVWIPPGLLFSRMAAANAL